MRTSACVIAAQPQPAWQCLAVNCVRTGCAEITLRRLNLPLRLPHRRLPTFPHHLLLSLVMPRHPLFLWCASVLALMSTSYRRICLLGHSLCLLGRNLYLLGRTICLPDPNCQFPRGSTVVTMVKYYHAKLKGIPHVASCLFGLQFMSPSPESQPRPS